MPPLTRSQTMARIRSRDTGPELAVRRALHAAGLRFRLHRRNLPGTPDLVLARHRAVVFVHGCFWHRHEACSRARMPATRREYWAPKFARNVARDSAAQAALLAAGWRVHVVWGCDVTPARLARLAAAIRTGASAEGSARTPLKTAARAGLKPA